MPYFLNYFIHPGFQNGHIIDHLYNFTFLNIKLNLS